MSNEVQLSEKYRSDPVLRETLEELTKIRSRLSDLTTDLCKVAYSCCSVRNKLLLSANRDERYSAILHELWSCASESEKNCDIAEWHIARLFNSLDVISEEAPADERGF